LIGFDLEKTSFEDWNRKRYLKKTFWHENAVMLRMRMKLDLIL